MSKTTTVNAIPYPEDTDAPNGPEQIKALAELLDTLKWGSRNLKPTTGQVISTESLVTTEALKLIPGMKVEITPDVASILWLKVAFWKNGVGGGKIMYFLNTVEKEEHGFGNDEGSRYVEFRVPLEAKLNTIEIKARNSGGVATIFGGQAVTRMMWELVAS